MTPFAKQRCRALRAPRTPRARARMAFTLIELIVAGVVATIVLSAVTFSLSQIGKARNLARDRVEAYQRAATALEAVRSDVVGSLRSDDLFDCRFLLTAASSRGTGYNRSELLLFNASLRSIRELDYQGEGTEYETAYRVEDDDLGSALWRRRDPVPDDVPDGGGMVEPVSDGLVAIYVEASDGEGSWQEEWDSDYDGMPKLVRISVTATGAPVGGEETGLTPEVTLSTVVALDRFIAPKADAPKEDEAAMPGEEGATDPAAGGTGGQPVDPRLGLGTSDGGDVAAPPGGLQGGGPMRDAGRSSGGQGTFRGGTGGGSSRGAGGRGAGGSSAPSNRGVPRGGGGR